MPAFFAIQAQGLTAGIRKLSLAAPEIQAATSAAVMEEANIVFRQSQVEVPVKTGALKGSGAVSPPVMVPGGVEIEISYGGAASAYAYIIHEGIRAGKPFTYHSGKPHFLSDPMKAAFAGMEARLAMRVREALGV